jgi:hypothetical protein
MAGRKGWTITGEEERVRAEAVAAAERAGMPVLAITHISDQPQGPL